MHELALFAGAGGGILGGRLLGWRTVCAVEINTYCAEILLRRQEEGALSPFPIWDDVETFDGRPWCGAVDIVSGGFPCQDISCAGKGAGINGKSSGLWGEMARIIREVQPRYVFVENSPMLTARGLGRVLGDLAEMGFNARWGVLGARHVGAPHRRDRIWILGYTNDEGESIVTVDAKVAKLSSVDANTGVRRHWIPKTKIQTRRYISQLCRWWDTEPDVGRVANGMAHRVDRLRALGNGQVPSVAVLAWRILSSCAS